MAAPHLSAVDVRGELSSSAELCDASEFLNLLKLNVDILRRYYSLVQLAKIFINCSDLIRGNFCGRHYDPECEHG